MSMYTLQSHNVIALKTKQNMYLKLKVFVCLFYRAKHVRKLFDEFDKDNSGSVSVLEAKQMLSKIEVPEDEVEGLVAIHDKNQDGELQYEEFVAFLLK